MNETMPDSDSEAALAAYTLLSGPEMYDHLSFEGNELHVDRPEGTATFKLSLAFREPTEEEFEGDSERLDIPETATVYRMVSMNPHRPPHHFGRHVDGQPCEARWYDGRAEYVATEGEWLEYEHEAIFDVFHPDSGLRWTLGYYPTQVCTPHSADALARTDGPLHGD